VLRVDEVEPRPVRMREVQVRRRGHEEDRDEGADQRERGLRPGARLADASACAEGEESTEPEVQDQREQDGRWYRVFSNKRRFRYGSLLLRLARCIRTAA